MSTMANTTPIVTTVTKTKEKTPKEADAAPRVNILDFCEEHYDDILPVIMDKIRPNKRKEVHTRLDFGENSKRAREERENSLNSRAENSPMRFHHERARTHGRERHDDRNVFTRLGHRKKSVHERLSDTYSPSITKSRPSRASSKDPSHSRGRSPSRDHSRVRSRLRGVEESYDDTYSSHRTRTKYRDRSHDRGRSRSVKRWRKSESSTSRGSESSASSRGRWKSKAKRRKLADEEDLAVPWTCEDVYPFTPRIRNFKSSRKTRMPNNVKTYDGTGDPEDHLKIFQAAAQVERWAMPTWCHIEHRWVQGSQSDFPSILYAAKEVREISSRNSQHQSEVGETIEEFMERFKIKTGRMKGALECMQISGFMHAVNNPELTKRLNEHVPKMVEEMMTATTAFIRGETAAASKKKARTPWKSQEQSKRHTSERRSDFRKFKPLPPMVTPVEKRSSSKFCEFHNDKRHNTDECEHLRKQIKEFVRAGKLSHFIKEIRQDRDQQKSGKKDVPVKDKAAAIYMIQPWQRATRQKVTQSFARVKEITFPPLAANKGTEGPLIIEVDIGGHTSTAYM
ncbi:hypothetical protein Tco_0889178 [Tanacetum coccineum]